MNPYENPELYQALILGGVASPGVVTISGAKRAVKWDVKDAKGQEGATTTRGSSPPVQFTATFFLVKDDSVGRDDFAAWEDFQILIESSTSGKQPVALSIYHPDLVRLNVTEVVNAGVGQMVHDDKGGATVAVEFIEYRPPKKKASGTAKPKPAGYNQAVAAGDAATQALKEAIGGPTAAEQELDALMKEASAP